MEFAKGESPKKPFRQFVMEQELKIFILNKFLKKWLIKNEDRIVKEIKEEFLKKQHIELDDEDIIKRLSDVKIIKKN